MGKMFNATIEIAYFDARNTRGDVPAQVMLDGRGLTLVMADTAGEAVLWHGERRGQGHYALSAPIAGMEGSLHRFADSLILEGFWRKDQERGFWRLKLPDDAVISQLNRVVKLPVKSRRQARKRAA